MVILCWGEGMVKNRLLEIRLKLGYKKQKDFAEYLGIGKSHYNKLENNNLLITVDILFRIARKLNIDINDIVYYEEDPRWIGSSFFITIFPNKIKKIKI